MGATTFADALSLHESGHTAAAITAYRAVVVVRDHPHAAAAYSNLGMLLGNEDKVEECTHFSAVAASLAPTNALVVYNLANAQMGLRRDDEAAATYKRVLTLERAHAPSYHNLALLAHRRGDSSLALQQFQLALQCGPEALAAIGGASQVYANMASVGISTPSINAEALAVHRTAVAANPRDPLAQVRLAEGLLEAAKATQSAAAQLAATDDAERALYAAVSLAPSDGHALNVLGTLLQSRPGRWQEAAWAYSAALTATPHHPDAYHNLGTVHQRLGRVEEARAMYKHALTIAPSVPNIYVSLASISPPPESSGLLRQGTSKTKGSNSGPSRVAPATALCSLLADSCSPQPSAPCGRCPMLSLL